MSLWHYFNFDGIFTKTSKSQNSNSFPGASKSCLKIITFVRLSSSKQFCHSFVIVFQGFVNVMAMSLLPKSDRNQHFSDARWRDAISPIGEISLGDQMPIIAWRRRRIFSSWMRSKPECGETRLVIICKTSHLWHCDLSIEPPLCIQNRDYLLRGRNRWAMHHINFLPHRQSIA